MKTKNEAISELGRSLIECNVMPVQAGETITRIDRITGMDGQARELIIVEQISQCVPAFDAGWRQTERGLLQSLRAQLRKGYGIKRGIVTDGTQFRYDR